MSERTTEHAAAAIVLDGATKCYGDPAGSDGCAVREVSLTVEPGELVVIRGRSGSGKTTLLNMMAGLAEPSSGRVALEGSDLWALSDAERSRLRNEAVGFVFQFPSLMPGLTALENIMLPAAFGRTRPDAETADRARELLWTVGIEEKENAYPRQLSAGQQQRVVLARALMNRPRVILADEPTSNLDEQTEQEMMALFRDVHRSTQVTIVMVTHALALISHGDRALEMAAGALHPAALPASEVLTTVG